ncbi:hypothetical protein JCM33374_g2145 [Metschnikowia sp. JCM 33374]|nr:hypothetical protein JCM33374_g2145 [Metschnikowia sp. JCM 33374]
MSNTDSNQMPQVSSFEKQRDQLVQEITAAVDSVVSNLDILNRSLQESIQVGSDFQDSSRLWATFYNGTNKNSASADFTGAPSPNELSDERSIPSETVEGTGNGENRATVPDSGHLHNPNSESISGESKEDNIPHSNPISREHNATHERHDADALPQEETGIN